MLFRSGDPREIADAWGSNALSATVKSVGRVSDALRIAQPAVFSVAPRPGGLRAKSAYPPYDRSLCRPLTTSSGHLITQGSAEAQIERPLLLSCFPGRSVVGSADLAESRGLHTSKCEDPG